eukprot:364993-Chlamydomonas_euryale.AAC.7
MPPTRIQPRGTVLASNSRPGHKRRMKMAEGWKGVGLSGAPSCAVSRLNHNIKPIHKRWLYVRSRRAHRRGNLLWDQGSGIVRVVYEKNQQPKTCSHAQSHMVHENNAKPQARSDAQSYSTACMLPRTGHTCTPIRACMCRVSPLNACNCQAEHAAAT